jgi:glycosyltransferase involved in cell wall biosynthesis
MNNGPKRLLLVTDAWYPQVNGVVRVLDTTKQLLEKRGVHVTVIHPELFRTVPLPSYPEIRLALFPRRRIRDILAAGDFDAIHLATEGPLGWAVRAICREKGIRYTTSYHTHFVLHVRARVRGFDRLVYAYLRRFHTGAERTMVATGSLRADLAHHGFRNLVLWPLGVDTELFKPNSAASLPYPRPIFTYMGRVAVEKSVEEFLGLDLPGTKLVIGDGPARNKLEAAHPSAIFTGYKKERELADLLAASDVFVFPSRTETFGLVVLEALACGVPAAAHDCMGPRDIIEDGVDGYLSEDLRDAALKALKLSREKCREKALQYTWEKSVDAFIANLVLRGRT